MKINTALVLCAGYGKRLNPLTLKNPKPLLKLNNLTLLENTINLIKKLDINDIKLNTFYLKDQIKVFIEKKIIGDIGILGDAQIYYCAAIKFKQGINPYDFANCFGETTMHYQYSLIALYFFLTQ